MSVWQRNNCWCRLPENKLNSWFWWNCVCLLIADGCNEYQLRTEMTKVLMRTRCTVLIFLAWQGMRYLHQSSVQYHGHLSSNNVVVDGRWTCKITDYGLRYVRNQVVSEDPGLITPGVSALRIVTPHCSWQHCTRFHVLLVWIQLRIGFLVFWRRGDVTVHSRERIAFVKCCKIQSCGQWYVFLNFVFIKKNLICWIAPFLRTDGRTCCLCGWDDWTVCAVDSRRAVSSASCCEECYAVSCRAKVRWATVATFTRCSVAVWLLSVDAVHYAAAVFRW